MNGRGRVLAIVPAWNEEASVGHVVQAIKDQGCVTAVLVVDDGSTDRTREVAALAGATVLRLPYNLGVGGAMRLGYRYAQQHDYDVTIQIDADDQHDSRYVPALLDALQDADIVIGARFAGQTGYSVRGPRRWAMVVLARTISRLSGVQLTDVTSGYRASNRKAIDLFAQTYPVEYLGDTVESLVLAVRSNLRVAQVPVDMRERTTGRPSQSPLRATLYLLRATLALLLALLRRTKAIRPASQ